MKNAVLIKVFVAMAAGVIAGLTTGSETEVFGVPWVDIYHLIGQLFLNGLTLVVVPLVASSIITGSARLGKEHSIGKLGSRTFFFFVLTTLIAVLVGAAIVLIFSPGSGVDAAKLSHIPNGGGVTELESLASGGIFQKIEQILYRLIPSNIFQVATQGQMLGIIVFSLLFGFFSSRVEASVSSTVINFWTGTFQVMMAMTHLVMRALPIGVFGLMAKVVATTGFDAFGPVAFFFLLVLFGLGLYTFVVLPLLLKVVGGVSPIQHFRAVLPALVTAFSTSSTAATLPITIDCMEKRAHIPNRYCSFILPLGTSINLSGTALYATATVIFIAQAYGMPLNVGTLTVIILMGLFTGLGMVAGIPSASLISIVVILQTLGLPPDGIILILAVERVLDMFRTAVSVFGNTCCTSLVYHLE